MPLGLLEELSRPALAGRYLRGRAILIGTLVLLTGTASYLVAGKRDDIWRSAHESVHGLALGLEASSAALLDQPLASLRGMRADLPQAEGSDAGVIAVLRNAARFDPASAYLGIVRSSHPQALAVAADGSVAPRQVGQALQQALRAPATDTAGVQPLIQLPGATAWYLPITTRLGQPGSRDFAFALVPAHRLSETADSLLMLGSGYLALATVEGERLIRYHKGTGQVEVNGPRLLPGTLALAARRPNGSAELYSPGAGQSVVIGWARSRNLPLYVSAAVPSTVLQARWLREAAPPMLAIVLGLAGAAVFGWQLRAALRENQAFLARLQHAADHDTLTGLLNRDAFSRSIQRSIEARPDQAFAVVLLDISGFKDINDTLGHEVGDSILQVAGTRLRDRFAAIGATVARLGGDEIGILTPVESTDGALDELRSGLQACLAEPTTVHGVDLELSASMGAALYPADGKTCVELLRCADIAMYSAKANFRAFSRYSEAMDHFTPEMLALKSEFSRALRDGELTVVFQPKVRLADGALVGVETLSRWVQPGKGAVPPSRFVPVAESSDLIHPFTQYVLQRALRQARTWLDAGHRVPVSVNVSTNNLLDPAFLDKVAASLTEAALPADMLELELTESAVMRQPDVVLRRLHALRELGVVLSVDDFGTGFASMTYLKQLPVQALKIDRSFVANLVSDPADQHIVRCSIQLAHEFGMSVIAEGVETAEVAELLLRFGCDGGQGYFYEKPLPGAEIAQRWLVDQRVN